MPSSADPKEIELLTSLARSKGFTVDFSVVPGLWRLIDRDLKPAPVPNGALAFTLEEANAFLSTLPAA